MNIRFADGDLEECATDVRKAVRRWGPVVGDRYSQRLAIISSVPTFEGLFTYRLLRLHKLSGDRQNTYAATIHGRWRLILRKISETEFWLRE
ncbi:MAG: hypothetical protein HYU30_07380 [Chloroflexi bacterium]|nr:hypothetical protein [Chloroflexota bacterium]